MQSVESSCLPLHPLWARSRLSPDTSPSLLGPTPPSSPSLPWRPSSTPNLGPCDFSLRPPLPGHLGEDDNLPGVLMAGGPQDQAVYPLPNGQPCGVT